MEKPDPEYIPRGESGRRPGVEHLALLSQLLDRAFRVPGTNWRFGLDPLLGLIPGLGDLLGSLLGAYSLFIARQLGAPASIQLRMLLNLTIDGVVGLVPFLGDFFDFAFKAHSRNAALLSQWLQTPRPVQRSSWGVVAVAGILMLALSGASVWLMVRMVQWLAGVMAG
jgi:hypothetical protein